MKTLEANTLEKGEERIGSVQSHLGSTRPPCHLDKGKVTSFTLITSPSMGLNFREPPNASQEIQNHLAILPPFKTPNY